MKRASCVCARVDVLMTLTHPEKDRGGGGRGGGGGAGSGGRGYLGNYRGRLAGVGISAQNRFIAPACVRARLNLTPKLNAFRGEKQAPCEHHHLHHHRLLRLVGHDK